MKKVIIVFNFIIIVFSSLAIAEDKKIMSVDCICESQSGYINAYRYKKPISINFEDGDVIQLKASSCKHLTVCPVRALTGTVDIEYNGWSSNTFMVYKFQIHGNRL